MLKFQSQSRTFLKPFVFGILFFRLHVYTGIIDPTVNDKGLVVFLIIIVCLLFNLQTWILITDAFFQLIQICVEWAVSGL